MSRPPILACLALALAVTSCCLPRHAGPHPELLGQPPLEPTRRAQEMAALAFVSYVGETLEGTDAEVEATLVSCIEKEISLQPLLRDRWQLVWGPAVYRFTDAVLDDNMMYVVRDIERPETLVVGVRGTNASAILDWLVEDLEVLRTEAWQWQRGAPDLQPRISEGTAKGLTILRQMKPTTGAGAGTTLERFLAGQVEHEEVRSVTVVGHSLGGALAPALGLYLEDTRQNWDPADRATVAVWGFAGPTPGDADFASYYDARLGASTQRVHNPFDIVPHAWQKDQMERIPGLYRPRIKPPFGLGEAVCLAIDLTERHHYTQQLQDAPPTRGHIFTGVPGYLKQVGCQHTCGYYRALDLVVWDSSTGKYTQHLKPISVDCKDFQPEPRCDLCPGWGGDS